MNAAARLALKLVGIYWVVGGLATFGDTVAHVMLYGSRQPAEGELGFAAMLLLAAASLVLFNVLPGALLMSLADAIAARLFPDGGAPFPVALSLPGGYVLGCTLIGLWYGLAGVAGIASAGVTSVLPIEEKFAEMMSTEAWQRLVVGVVNLALGLLVYRHGRASSQALAPPVP